MGLLLLCCNTLVFWRCDSGQFLESADEVRIADSKDFDKLVKKIEETKKVNSVKNISVALSLLVKEKE